MKSIQSPTHQSKSVKRIISKICVSSKALINQIRQINQSTPAQILGDIVGAICLFAMLFVGLFYVAVFQ